MKPFSFEEIFPTPTTPEIKNETPTEGDAERLLEEILNNPANAFLTEIPMNRDVIESADSYLEALTFAQKRIRERLERTLNVREVIGNHVEPIFPNPNTVTTALEHINQSTHEIGIGADGRVVIDPEDAHLNPNVCYKLSLLEKVKRGRNSVAEEAELQGAFYELAQSLESKDIGVPAPYYEIEVFATQMIVMERLHAKSADDIIRGLGTVPEWLDIDRFCDSLKSFLDAAHSAELYHRDLHFGNVMISQMPTWQEGETMGYVIDFGLSAYAQENMEPYRKESAGQVFTYDDDYGRIEGLRTSLKTVRERRPH